VANKVLIEVHGSLVILKMLQMVRCGPLWSGVVLQVVRCGQVRSGVVRCGPVLLIVRPVVRYCLRFTGSDPGLRRGGKSCARAAADITVTVTINGLVKLLAFNAHIYPSKYPVSF